MNEKEAMPRGGVPEAADEEMLQGIRRRMAAVETLIPVPPAWTHDEGRAAMSRTRMRTGLRLAVAPLVLVAVLIVIVVGAGLSARTATLGASPSPRHATLVYELVPDVGKIVTAADRETTATILRARIESTGIVDSIVTVEGDTVVVKVPGDANLDGIEALLGMPGSLEFVLLPPEIYGTAETPGSKPIPAVGDRIDPALPAQFTGADLDRSKTVAAVDQTLGVGTGAWQIEFAFNDQKAGEFATWSGEHVNDYFAIALDGVVQNVPYIQSKVEGGQGIISGNFTADQAKSLAELLRSGTLPCPLRLVSLTGPDVPATPETTPIPSDSPASVPSAACSIMPSPGASTGLAAPCGAEPIRSGSVPSAAATAGG
jgi:hypothetical protein